MISSHAGASPGELWAAWNLDPVVLLGILLPATLYARGVSTLWNRGTRRGVSLRRVVAFYAGLVSLLIAVVSPLDALSHALFSAHMVQHLTLVLLAAPLLVYGAPLVPISLGLPQHLRRGMHGVRSSTVVQRANMLLLAAPVVWSLHAATLWMWHVPAPYERALTSEVVHAFEHVCFLGSALLLWTLVIGSARRRRLDRALAAGLLFFTALQSGALGVVLTFASSSLYEGHSAAAWGLDPLTDQQLAGVIMWVPSGIVYLIAIVVLAYRWLEDGPLPAEPDGSVTARLSAGENL
ncbi:MAG: cytochrome c oxidase assembly protein [Actinomycetota bacterium]